ncbi:MAG TPA: D-alanyl-D-alanine carboxypeptidase, partial [Gemmatimonadaceae bacterium]|nr:D-alanyl-D-alanine carboxypeptidase [Gemmatimonadaceae bacterium]
MKRLLALCASYALGAAGCAPASVPPTPPPPLVPPPTPREALRGAIDSMVSVPQFRNAHWGVLIVDPESGDTLYSHNAGKLFMPASNMKIVTGAAALALLGADYRFRTTVVAVGSRRGGVLDGDLIVHGRGDP